MRLAAESTALIPERSTDPLEHVDYRLATTAEEKDKIYRLRYRAYLREGAIMPSPSERVIDQHDDAPNSWTFGIYIHGELYSSLRVTLLTSELRDHRRPTKYSTIYWIPSWIGTASSSIPRASLPIPKKQGGFLNCLM